MDIVVTTARRVEAIDITDLVLEHELPDGLVLASLPHTTAALMVSEADADLLLDFERVAEGWATGFEPFQHHKNDNTNGAAHILSAFVGCQVFLSVQQGTLELGNYQRLVLLELDGPKERHVQFRPVVPVALPPGEDPA